MSKSFEIIGRRKIWYCISLLILIPGLISFMFRGLNLGIDFTGGNLIQIQFEEHVTSEQVRSVVSKFVSQTPSISETEGNSFLIRTVTLEEEKSDQLITSISQELGKNQVLRNEHVGPVIGKELAQNAIIALLIASVLMVGYITFRFELRFAVAAILSLLHDVFITIGIFSLLQIEVDSTFVAAILTIVGYSINDTIVIFDRIRENLRNTRKEDVERVANTSVLQTMTRSINTVLTTIFTLAALLLFGGATTKVFALALLIGIVSGAYSSIFTASPLWVDLRHLAEKKKYAKA